MHTALLEYISSGIKHLPDGLNGFVQALYAIGGEAPKFLDPISGVSASGWLIMDKMAINGHMLEKSDSNVL